MLNNNPTLTLEREDDFSTTLEVIEITAQEAGESCTKGQQGHEARNSAGEIVTCVQVGEDSWAWRLGRP